MPRIIGIDPGLASTGWGVVDCNAGKIRYVSHGIIETKAAIPLAERLLFIMESLGEILDLHKPAVSAVETLYFGNNVSSAIHVAQATGVILATLAGRKIVIHELSPNLIKKGITGVSRSDKKQVQEMTRIFLGLPEIPKPDHAADALGAAICAANITNTDEL